MPTPANCKFDAICIFGTMRTGSNLLERIMIQNPNIIGFGEIFNPRFISRHKLTNFHGVSIEDRNENPRLVLDKVFELAEGRKPLFRYFPSHLPVGFDAIINDPRIAKIFLKRNPVDSYISLQIARDTERWLQIRREDEQHDALIEFDSFEFYDWNKITNGFYETIEARLKETGQEYFLIDYENIKNYGMLDLLGEFLGLGRAWPQYIEPIAKQNPKARENYLKNPEALREISLPEWQPLKFEDRKADPIVEIGYWAQKLNLIHVPIYGNGLSAEIKALEGANGAEITPVFTKDIEAVLRDNPDITAYTRVINPMDRIYTILMRHLLQDENGFNKPFAEILRDLIGTNISALPSDHSQEAFSSASVKNEKQMKPILRKFIVNLRKELWGGFRNHLMSNQFWPQYQQVKNLSENFTLEVIIGDEFPNNPPFLALKEHEPIIDPYLLAPFDARAYFRGSLDQQIHALYGEDFEEYGFENSVT